MVRGRNFDAGAAAARSDAAREPWETADTQQDLPVLRDDKAANDKVVPLDRVRDPEKDTEFKDAVYELPDDVLESIPPWEEEERDAHLAEVQARQQRDAKIRNRREQAKVREQIARIDQRSNETPDQKKARVRQTQAVDMRRRELSIQKEIASLSRWSFKDRKRRKQLESSLRIVTERLNGLTQSTPEMRRLQRQQAVTETVGDAIPSQKRMHQAAAKRETFGYKVAKFFGFGKKTGKVDGRLHKATVEYADDMYRRRGEVSLSDSQMKEAYSLPDEFTGAKPIKRFGRRVESRKRRGK